MSDQAIMDKLKKFTVKDLREAVGKKNKKYKNANPYTGYSTAKKEDLIKMIMTNKNDFKDMVKIKEPITVESIKKKEEKKTVKKSVDKQETKKAEPIKKSITKTAQKADVQGVTSKDKTNENDLIEFEKRKKDWIKSQDWMENFKIEKIIKELKKTKDSKERVVLINKYNKMLKEGKNKTKENQKEMMDIIKILKKKKKNQFLVDEIKKEIDDYENEVVNKLSKNINEAVIKYKKETKDDVQGVTSKKKSNGKIEDKIDEFGEQYGDIEDEDFEENKEEFEDLFKNVVEYLKKNKSKMSKEQIKSLMSIIKDIKDKKKMNK
jgi:hypothetical protein